jgi:hypothetical protein
MKGEGTAAIQTQSNIRIEKHHTRKFDFYKQNLLPLQPIKVDLMKQFDYSLFRNSLSTVQNIQPNGRLANE